MSAPDRAAAGTIFIFFGVILNMWRVLHNFSPLPTATQGRLQLNQVRLFKGSYYKCLHSKFKNKINIIIININNTIDLFLSVLFPNLLCIYLLYPAIPWSLPLCIFSAIKSIPLASPSNRLLVMSSGKVASTLWLFCLVSPLISPSYIPSIG